MIVTLARHAMRECLRRPLPYVAAVSIILLTLASRLFLALSFGAAAAETVHLAVSAVFLAGLVFTALQGTALVRRDLERGTLGLLLTKPVGLGAYVAGRFLGLTAAAILCCALVALGVAGVLLLFPPESGSALPAALLAGWARTLLPITVLSAAALLVSSLAPRVAAPIMLVAVFVAGSLPGQDDTVFLLPNFGLFGLDAGATASMPLLCAYSAIYASIFLVLTYIVLASKAPLRSQT